MYSENRPWGSFHILDEKPGFKVKRLVAIEGGRLSLQSHKHRSEHWTVVSAARATATNSVAVRVKRTSIAARVRKRPGFGLS